MKYYHVVCGKKHMDLIRAKDAEHAILIVEKIFGKASRYSSTHEYKAVEA